MRRLTLAALLLANSLPACAASAALTKDNGVFRLTGQGRIPAPLGALFPMLTEYSEYPRWALQNINRPREGRKKGYFLSIEGLDYDKDRETFKLLLSIRLFFKGKHSLSLSVTNRLNQTPPQLSFELARPTRLVFDAVATLTLHEAENGRAAEATLDARAKTHWALYHLAPFRVLRANAEDRVLIVLENAVNRFRKNPNQAAPEIGTQITQRLRRDAR